MKKRKANGVYVVPIPPAVRRAVNEVAGRIPQMLSVAAGDYVFLPPPEEVVRQGLNYLAAYMRDGQWCPNKRPPMRCGHCYYCGVARGAQAHETKT